MKREQALFLPTPRKVELRDGQVRAPAELLVRTAHPEDVPLVFKGIWPARPAGAGAKAWVACEVRPDVGGAESYRLTIQPVRSCGEPRARIIAGDRAGARHGLRTLAQLLVQYGASLPALAIADAPSFAIRGAMLDISRDRVPRMEELFAYVDCFAAWKLNYMELYTEHTFAYAGHEEVWREASPVTPGEVRELDAYAKARGVILGANQNCFGHMERWLKHARYRPLAEVPPGGSWEAWGRRRGEPWGLCPGDPGSIALIEDLLDQLLPNFSSGRVNIGCDETWDLGQGRSHEAVAREGMPKVYFGFLEKILACVKRHGFRAAFWADIAFHHPEALHLIPAELTALAWGYEPTTRFGEMCAALRKIGREAWVCPGASSWCSITGRTFERRANLAAAARGGAREGALGYMVTDWGDMGHRQQWPIGMHGIAEAADAAWNAKRAGSFDARASSLHVFGDETLECGPWLDELGDVDRELRRIAGGRDAQGRPRPLGNRTCLFGDLHESWGGAFKPGAAATWRGILARLEDLASRLPRGVSRQVRAELRHTVNVARVAAERAILRRQDGPPSAATRRRLAKRLREALEEHRKLWLRRSRPGGLKESRVYYERIIESLNHCTATAKDAAVRITK